ncbi:MAG: DUF6786 family protein [Sandaracinaceae bacterium]
MLDLRRAPIVFALPLTLLACGGTSVSDRVDHASGDDPSPYAPGSFGDDVAFLHRHHPDLVVLERGDAQVAVAPAYQGRVMTSTAAGDDGASFGWINRALIASGETTPHMNAFGGEDRFWLGPEGGQYGLYFPVGAPYEFEVWQVPAAIDTEAWAVEARSETEAVFTRRIELSNHSGTAFTIGVRRAVRLLDPESTEPELELPPEVQAVCYETDNAIQNLGDAPWTPEQGLLSIWILSMYNPSPSTTVVIPYRPDGEGPIVNAAYFGQVPPDRLRIDEEAGVIYFVADGRQRGKIGVPAGRARPILGSWDASRGALTLVRYTLPEAAPHGYVNSMWEDQAAPYGGDVANSYNDGPPAPGEAPLGPFYELESSSPAAALGPRERLTHVHRTFHLVGERAALDEIARAQLGVGLDAIESAFAP